MSDANDGEPTWLLEPPGAGEVELHIATGDDVELSPEAREALDRLIEAIQGHEVTGFGTPCTFNFDCYPYSCNLDNCQPLYKKPCKSNLGCRIASPSVRP